MEFKQVRQNGENYHRVGFSAEEAPVVRGAFRESLFKSSERGNTGSFSEFEEWISNWRGDKPKSALFRTLGHLAEVLEEFHYATNDAIAEIPAITKVPPFLNNEIGRRKTLGRRAAEMAVEVRVEEERLVSISHEEGPADLDKEFQQLLGGEGQSPTD